MSEQYPGDIGGRPVPGPPEDARYFGPYDAHPPVPGLVAEPVADGPGPRPSTRERRPLRAGAVIGVAAVTALVVGGGAGYGGTVLATRTAPTTTTPAATASPAADPSADPSETPAPPTPTSGHSIDAVEVAKRVVPGTVMIKVGRSTGSGFVLDDKGRIVTNNHVVAGAASGSSIRVIFANGRRQKAKLVGRSPSYDVAVIKVKASAALKPIGRADSARVAVGQPVIAVGAPLGLPGTVTQGIVSARNRAVAVKVGEDADSPTAYIDAIQTDAPINPGNSGGPLITADAKVVGVNSAILTLGSGQGQAGNIGLGFAIPINQVNTISQQLIKKGRATYPVLGADVDSASGGVELTAVQRRGPAARAGLRRGDLVTKIDGKSVTASEELIVAIRTRRPGQSIELDYQRGSRRAQAKVTLGSKAG